MLKNKKLEIRIAPDKAPEGSSGASDAQENFPPEVRIITGGTILVETAAKLTAAILVLRFTLRIVEHIIVTKVK